MDELNERHATWCASLQRAVQADRWGQVLEAVEAYERLSETLAADLPQCHELSPEQKTLVEKTARSVDTRAKCLSAVDGDSDAPTKEDMENVLDALRGLLSEEPPVFPMDLADRQQLGGTKASAPRVMELDGGGDDRDLEDYSAQMESATKKPVVRARGGSYLDIRIGKIGLKDAATYVNPTIVVSVFDEDGKPIEEGKETSVGRSNEPQYVSFGDATIHLETSLDAIAERGAAVFFEFYHFKSKKRKKSCRCWTLLEMDEIKKGPLALELYQKPMDPKRKRINLFTVKDLFLHITLEVTAV